MQRKCPTSARTSLHTQRTARCPGIQQSAAERSGKECAIVQMESFAKVCCGEPASLHGRMLDNRSASMLALSSTLIAMPLVSIPPMYELDPGGSMTNSGLTSAHVCGVQDEARAAFHPKHTTAMLTRSRTGFTCFEYTRQSRLDARTRRKAAQENDESQSRELGAKPHRRACSSAAPHTCTHRCRIEDTLPAIPADVSVCATAVGGHMRHRREPQPSNTT